MVRLTDQFQSLCFIAFTLLMNIAGAGAVSVIDDLLFCTHKANRVQMFQIAQDIAAFVRSLMKTCVSRVRRYFDSRPRMLTASVRTKARERSTIKQPTQYVMVPCSQQQDQLRLPFLPTMAQKPPFILEAIDKNAPRPATFIFLHGFGDEAEGLPLGMSLYLFPDALSHVSCIPTTEIPSPETVQRRHSSLSSMMPLVYFCLSFPLRGLRRALLHVTSLPSNTNHSSTTSPAYLSPSTNFLPSSLSFPLPPLTIL